MGKSNEENKQLTVVQNVVNPIMDIMEKAKDLDIDKLEKVLMLQERWEKKEAEKAYNSAMALFNSEEIKIVKNKKVDFQTSKGRVSYSHAELEDITRAVKPALAKYGLFFKWETSVDNNIITVTCICSHESGHSERISLPSTADTSGTKNAIQAMGSTITYLQRYTLMSLLGLSAGADDDGKNAVYETIKTDQIIEINDLLALAFDEDETKIKNWFGKCFRNGEKEAAHIKLTDYNPVKNALTEIINGNS